MSEYDASTYERFSGAVRRQVQSLRIILDNLQVILDSPIKKHREVITLGPNYYPANILLTSGDHTFEGQKQVQFIISWENQFHITILKGSLQVDPSAHLYKL